MDPSQSHQASEMHKELMTSFEELKVLLQTTAMPVMGTTASRSKNSETGSSNTTSAGISELALTVHDLWKTWEENTGKPSAMIPPDFSLLIAENDRTIQYIRELKARKGSIIDLYY